MGMVYVTDHALVLIVQQPVPVLVVLVQGLAVLVEPLPAVGVPSADWLNWHFRPAAAVFLPVRGLAPVGPHYEALADPCC